MSHDIEESGNMKWVTLDEKGRILLGRKIAEQYGEKFIIVKSPRELILLPVPKDPAAAMAELGKGKVDSLTLPEMRQLIRQQAEEELDG
ncbi:MAG TPA: hypothetical protein VJK52_06385 [Candidatus Nanoarchaeia archaeon]|nr:hypothetical protein [Candidatus Nanoarchaeia archaeon]